MEGEVVMGMVMDTAVDMMAGIVMDTAVIAVDTVAEVVAEEAKCCQRSGVKI